MFTQCKITYLAALLFGLSWAARGEPVIPKIDPQKSYVVIASAKTAKDDAWRAVIDVLRRKYDGALILYPEGEVESTLPHLRQIHPRFAVFVAPPEESGRDFVVAVHRLTRKLDDDPFTDVRWGIVTGYDASDALRIAKRKEPLIIKSAASSMGPGSFNNLDAGFASSETDPHKFWIKKDGGKTEELKVDPDPVKSLVDAFNAQSPDMFVTSGHATEQNWQVIYNQNIGYFLCKKGQLYGRNSKKKSFAINSPGAKIYMPMGNCLIGHIPNKDCMATAWMHTGGVHQMFGYTTVTFHGYMGWGIGSFFNDKYSLSESFYFNNQSLIWELWKLFPTQAHIEFADYDQRHIDKLSREHRIRDKKLMGHLWDRDVVAFYGDPAWDARHDVSDPAWRATWQHTGESVKIEITVLKGGKWGNRPLAIPFPVRLQRIRGADCSHGMKPLITDDFALFPVMGEARKVGETITLTFGAFAVKSSPTSADAAPIDLTAPPTTSSTDSNETFDPRELGLTQDETKQVLYACRYAGKNLSEIIKAFNLSKKAEVKDTAFLVANMPERDLVQLNGEYIVENVHYAQKSLANAPWKDEITPELYQEYILPYANLSEQREDWRKIFYDRVQPLVADCKRPGEAALKLNAAIFDLLNVKYHPTKRPRPDTGPLESIEAGYASCTGLSILLVNACRSAGVPARIAGVAQWTKGEGNHTWVEVWDKGWHCLGASESKKLDSVWFGKGTAAADLSDPMKRIYAAKFSRSTLTFPLAWNPYANYVPATDVSAWYKEKFGDGDRE